MNRILWILLCSVVLPGVAAAATATAAPKKKVTIRCATGNDFKSKEVLDMTLALYSRVTMTKLNQDALRAGKSPVSPSLPPLLNGTQCDLWDWIIDPKAAKLKVEKYCDISTPLANGLTQHSIVVALLVRDTCNRQVRLAFTGQYGGCPNAITGNGDPLLLPLKKVSAFRPLKGWSEFVIPETGKHIPEGSDATGFCPPYAPIYNDNAIKNPNQYAAMYFYTHFVPYFQRVWSKQQNPKPFTSRATMLYTQVHDAMGLASCTSKDGKTVVLLASPTVYNPTRHLLIDEDKEWSSYFYMNATALTKAQDERCSPKIIKYSSIVLEEV